MVYWRPKTEEEEKEEEEVQGIGETKCSYELYQRILKTIE